MIVVILEPRPATTIVAPPLGDGRCHDVQKLQQSQGVFHPRIATPNCHVLDRSLILNAETSFEVVELASGALGVAKVNRSMIGIRTRRCFLSAGILIPQWVAAGWKGPGLCRTFYAQEP